LAKFLAFFSHSQTTSVFSKMKNLPAHSGSESQIWTKRAKTPDCHEVMSAIIHTMPGIHGFWRLIKVAKWL
jgi:hypothetical protein